MIEGDVTKAGQKLLYFLCVDMNRKKSMVLRDNKIAAERFGRIFEPLGRSSGKFVKKLVTNKMKNPGKASGSKFGNAAVYKTPKAVLSTNPAVRNFCHTGKGLNF